MDKETLIKALTDITKEADEKKAVAKRVWDWITKHKVISALGATAGLGGAGYGGYRAVKHSKNKKKSSLFDEDVINEIADQIIKEATVNGYLRSDGTFVPLNEGKMKGILNWISKHKLPTGLGAAALLAGGGYGGYRAVNHFKNKKKSSEFDEDDFINLVYDSILKKASEEEDTIDEDQVINYLADLVDEEELSDDYSEEDGGFDEEDFDEDDVKLAADLVADAVIDKIAGFTEQGTEREKMKALLHAKMSKAMEDIINKYPGMSYAKLQIAAPVYNKLMARKNAYKSTQKGLNRLKATIPFVGMGRKGQEALENLLKEEKE